MRDILTWIWRIYYRKKLLSSNVKIDQGCVFNDKTVFEDNNVINKNSHLYNSYIGRGTYIGAGSVLNNTRIGRFCSIGTEVRVVLGNHPAHTWVSTHPAFFSVNKQAGFTFVKANKWYEKKLSGNGNYECIIDNDVWIGDRVLILAGLKIADGCILAAGAVVTKDTEPYCIYAGIPARKIGQRFDDCDIEKLLSVCWWETSMSELSQQADLFESMNIFAGFEGKRE